MPKKGISKKQQDLQLVEARNKKIKELEVEYYEYQKLLKDVGWDSKVGEESVEQYVERRIFDWDEKQRVPVSGIYYDPEKVTSTYQQKFIYYFRECVPDALEELRDLVSLFDRFFGDKKENYLLIFFREKMQFYELNYSFERTIDHLILQTIAFKFKPNKYDNYPYDYRWGDYKVLLYILYLLFVPSESKEERQKVLTDTFTLLRETVGIQRQHLPEKYEESRLQTFYEEAILNIVKEFILGEQREYFLKDATRKLEDFLKDISSANDPIPAFIELQFEILNWADRHKIGKDWILRYAYFFLAHMSKNPDVPLSEVEIPPLNSRSLAAGPFEFRFNGWSAGDESKEDYETRITEHFNSKLSDYFTGVGRSLKLNRKKRLTKPIEYDRVKWLVRWTVQKWTKDEILAEIDKEFQKKGLERYYSPRTIETAFAQFKDHCLPVRE